MKSDRLNEDCFLVENVNEQGNAINISSGSNSEIDFVTIDEMDLYPNVVSHFSCFAG